MKSVPIIPLALQIAGGIGLMFGVDHFAGLWGDAILFGGLFYAMGVVMLFAEGTKP